MNITIIFSNKLQLFCFWLHFDCSCTGLLVFTLWLFHLYGKKKGYKNLLHQKTF